MRVSKYFVLTVVILVFLAFVVNFFITKKFSSTGNPQALSTLDTYLFENYSMGLLLDKKVEDAISVYCDKDAEATSSPASVVYACQNKNPVHKIIIGSVGGDQSYVNILKSIGDEQLFWKNTIDGSSEAGRMVCKEWSNAKGYDNVTAGIYCTTIAGVGTKLYSTIIFLEPKAYQKRKVFIAVVNTLQSSSIERTEQEIVSLLSKQKTSRIGKIFNFILFLKNDAIKIGKVIEVSSADSLESGRVDMSVSSNFVSPTSGEGIDSEVCDASKISSCYPIYCNSSTAVWANLLHSCVEPIVPNKAAIDGVLCLGDFPIWDGSQCRALAGNIISSNFCLIDNGSNSCEMKFIWSVNSLQQKKVEVRYIGSETTILSNAATGSMVYPFPYSETPQIVGLFEGDKKINEGKFVTKCRTGGFDIISQKCVDPQFITGKVLGGYYGNPGNLIFSCANTDNYTVTNTDKNLLVATGTYVGEVSTPLDIGGNYSVTCVYGTYRGQSSVVYYNTVTPAPTLSLSLTPRLVKPGGTTTLDWSIMFPQESCSLSSKIFCASTGCTPEQIESEVDINHILEAGSGDTNQGGMLTQIQDSLTSFASGTYEGEWTVSGVKTLKISYTTDFILSCGNGTEMTRRVFTQKTQKSEEQ